MARRRQRVCRSQRQSLAACPSSGAPWRCSGPCRKQTGSLAATAARPQPACGSSPRPLQRAHGGWPGVRPREVRRRLSWARRRRRPVAVLAAVMRAREAAEDEASGDAAESKRPAGTEQRQSTLEEFRLVPSPPRASAATEALEPLRFFVGEAASPRPTKDPNRRARARGPLARDLQLLLGRRPPAAPSLPRTLDRHQRHRVPPRPVRRVVAVVDLVQTVQPHVPLLTRRALNRLECPRTRTRRLLVTNRPTTRIPR